MMTFSKNSFPDDLMEMYTLMTELSEMLWGEWDYDTPYRLWALTKNLDDIQMLDEYQRDLLKMIVESSDDLQHWSIGMRSYSDLPQFIDTDTFIKMYELWEHDN